MMLIPKSGSGVLFFWGASFFGAQETRTKKIRRMKALLITNGTAVLN
jgi:hypothetical protein